MSENLTGYKTRKAGWVMCTPVYCFFPSKLASITVENNEPRTFPCFPRGWLEMWIGSIVVYVAYANGESWGL